MTVEVDLVPGYYLLCSDSTRKQFSTESVICKILEKQRGTIWANSAGRYGSSAPWCFNIQGTPITAINKEQFLCLYNLWCNNRMGSPTCLGKRQYSRLEAFNTLSKIRSGELGIEYDTKKMYKCPLCQFYHLSSVGPETNLDKEWRKIQKENQ